VRISITCSLRTNLAILAAVALALAILSAYVNLQRLKEREEGSQDCIRKISLLGGNVDGPSADIPACFFLRASEHIFVPESISDVNVVGVITADHDLNRLPEKMIRLSLTIAADAVPHLPVFSAVRDLRLNLMSKSGNSTDYDFDAKTIRSRFSSQLERFSLGGDAGVDNVLQQFRDSSSLKSLFVGGEGFNGRGFTDWPEQRNLEYCYIEGKLEQVHFQRFPSLPGVRCLTISTKLHLSSGLSWLRRCPNVEILELSCGSIEDVAIADIRKLNKLRTLEFRGVQDLDLFVFGDIQSLLRLEMERCKLRNIDLPGSTVIHIKELILKKTEVNLKSLKQMIGLHFIETDAILNFNSIFEAEFPESLVCFRCDYVDVSDEELTQLKAKFPWVTFSVPTPNMNKLDPASRRLKEDLIKLFGS
jgi:hypothetical protein